MKEHAEIYYYYTNAFDLIFKEPKILSKKDLKIIFRDYS